MSKKAFTAVTLVAAAMLAGCAASVQRSQPLQSAASMGIPAASGKRVVLNVQLAPQHPQDSGWASFKKEWIDIAREQTLAQGLQFSAQEGEPKPMGEDGTLMVVRINDYRYVSVGSRMMLGIMTGNAFIDAKVEFRDLKTGTEYGERSYNTASSAGQGVFAPVTPKQIYAIVDETLAEIKPR